MLELSRLGLCKWAALVALGASLACGETEGPLLVYENGGSAGNSTSTAGSGGGGTGSTLVFQPAPGTTWQVQLSGTVDTSLDVELYYIDPDFTSEAALGELRAAGRKIACYLSAGSYEPWRSDADEFPAEVVGNSLPDYPREQWLDITSAVVRELIAARLDHLAAERCDAAVPTNLSAYEEDSGFAIDRALEVDYIRWLGQEVHARGMSVGLVTSEELSAELEPEFDWAYSQDCLTDTGCAGLQPFLDASKAVFIAEFGDESSAPAICANAEGTGFDVLVKDEALDAFRIACPPAK